MTLKIQLKILIIINSQYPTQNINNKHTQIPTKQTNNIENNNMVNLIENKKENFEKILQEKPKKLLLLY